jgi:PAS domain S-box-containing protein
MSLAPLEHLDLATVIKVSQAVSGEVVLEKVLDTLMRTAIEHAGAERALLILSRNAEQRIVAEATAFDGAVMVHLCDQPVIRTQLPESVLQYVLRTHENVILDDASAPNPFSADPYIDHRRARSVFCLPLASQAKLIGALFLENNLAPRVFAPARTAVLKVLASQAAISIENTRLFRDLAERETRIRRLVDANIIGIFSWHADGRVLDANEEFVRIIGHSRDDLVSGRVRWTDFTPEWRERDAREMERLRTGASSQAQERELLRKDGTRVPVLTGGTMFDGSMNEGVAFVLDLTERKRAEQCVLAEHRVTRILAEAVTVEKAIPRILQTLCEQLRWDLAAWWRVDLEAGVLRFAELWRAPSVEAPEFEGATRASTFPVGIGLCGRAWASRLPVCIADVARDPTFRRAGAAGREGLHAGFAFPILLGGEVLGVIDLVSREIREPDQRLLDMMATLGSQIGQLFERERAEKALRESERESRLIVNTIPGLVATLTPSGEVEAVNDQVTQYCGQPLEAMREWGTNGTVHAEDLPHVAEVFAPAIASGQPYDFEARIRRFDGIYRWFQVRGLPLHDTHGQIVRWYVLLSDVDDRKRAEMELRQAYDGFVDAQRLSKTGTFITDLVADDHNWSEELRRIFEFEPGSKVTLQRFRELVHPDDLPEFEAKNASAMTGEDVKTAFRIVTPRGGVKHLRGVAHVIEKKEGRPLFVGAVQDVTESAIADEALRESERETRLIVNTIPGLVAILNPSGEIEVVNDQLVAYCGLPLEDMRQWGTNGIVHPEDVPHAVEIFEPAIANGEAFEFEARLRRFDGVYRWFQIRGLPLRDSRGQVVRWYSLNTDVDDRKRAEVELRRAYDSFVDAQRLSKTGSFIADIVADDNVFSEEALRIFELDPATKITVERIREVIHPDDLAGWDAMIARAMSGGDVTFAYRIITARGAVKHVRGVAHVREQVAGRPLFVGAIQDVTESVAAEEALNRARSELAHVTRVTTVGELTASIAHEVKQPIAASVTSAQTALRWLEARPPELGEVRDALARIVQAGKRAGDVVGRIRALVTKAPPRKDAVDINAAIGEIVELTRGEAVKNRVAVLMDLADGLPPTEGDRVQLQQVILNLILNGIEAMSGGDAGLRELRIRSRKDGSGGILVAVADTGPGLAEGASEQVFAAFYTTKAAGLGLGLSICRSIVEAHDGRLWASANEPRGALFQFTLPIPAR